jgi:hypothetical protein
MPGRKREVDKVFFSDYAFCLTRIRCNENQVPFASHSIRDLVYISQRLLACILSNLCLLTPLRERNKIRNFLRLPDKMSHFLMPHT